MLESYTSDSAMMFKTQMEGSAPAIVYLNEDNVSFNDWFILTNGVNSAK
jgi:hypothetical protein